MYNWNLRVALYYLCCDSLKITLCIIFDHGQSFWDMSFTAAYFPIYLKELLPFDAAIE